MKPQTLEVMTGLAIDEFKNSMKQLLDDIDGELDASDMRDAATDCRNIADVAEALENILLTAADEVDRVNAEAEAAVLPDLQMMSVAVQRSVQATRSPQTPA